MQQYDPNDIASRLIKSVSVESGGRSWYYAESCQQCGRHNSYTPKPKDAGDRSVYLCPHCHPAQTQSIIEEELATLQRTIEDVRKCDENFSGHIISETAE